LPIYCTMIAGITQTYQNKRIYMIFTTANQCLQLPTHIMTQHMGI
jgi:hypothetical protein